MEKQELTLYLDFYHDLLTKHTRNVLHLYVDEDLSFGEIAEELQISRQAVHDRFKKGKELLLSLEEDLQLIAKFEKRKKLFKELRYSLQHLEEYLPKENQAFVVELNNKIKALEEIE